MPAPLTIGTSTMIIKIGLTPLLKKISMEMWRAFTLIDRLQVTTLVPLALIQMEHVWETLRAAGVDPSSELLALSEVMAQLTGFIRSKYVCG